MKTQVTSLLITLATASSQTGGQLNQMRATETLAQTSVQHLATYGMPNPTLAIRCPQSDCDLDQFLDQRDCLCKELPTLCKDGDTWDPVRQACHCLSQRCPANQFFDSESCQCRCDEYQECADPDNYWNADKCACTCIPRPETCTPLESWDSETCSCEFVPLACISGEYFDSVSGNCRNVPVVCDDFQVFDDRTRQCECAYQHNECSPGFYFDTKSCSCRCEIQACPDVNLVTSVAKFYWDPTDCLCKCKQNLNCPSDEFFCTESCQCLKQPLSCGEDQFYDEIDHDCKEYEATCADHSQFYNIARSRCETFPVNCGANRNWNTSTNTCEASARACPVDRFWNASTESCLCETIQCQETTDGPLVDVNNRCKCECDFQICTGIGFNGLPLIFDPYLCECVCVVNQVCDASEYWDIITCSCQPIPCVCPDNQYWNRDSSACECFPEICQLGKVWDSRICKCVCTPQECPPGLFWDYHSCTCLFEPCDCEGEPGAPREFYDNISGECVCDDPGFCFDGSIPSLPKQIWDYQECVCIYVDQFSCNAEGQYWDTRIGACRFASMCNCSVDKFYDFNSGECQSIPQTCADTQFWNSTEQFCACAPEPCLSGFFFDFDSCNCRCEFQDCDADEFFNALTCACETIPDDCDPETQYFDKASESCKCKLVKPQDPKQQFNTDTCLFECQAKECNDTWYYFDFDQCACLCLDQVCPVGYAWNRMMCTCDCDLSNDDCAPNEFFDETCCCCRPCKQLTACPEDYIFNANFCECQCLQLVECTAGLIWDYRSCRCSCEDQVEVACANKGFGYDPIRCICDELSVPLVETLLKLGISICEKDYPTYSAAGCDAVLTSSIRQLECYWHLDGRTDIDDPVESKVQDVDYCSDELGRDRMPRKALQSSDPGVTLVAPDNFDLYGDPNQILDPVQNEYNFFLFSSDRSAFCPDRSWISVDPSSCHMHGGSRPTHTDASNATNFKFELGLAFENGSFCYFWQVFVDAPETPCDGYILDFISQDDDVIKFVRPNLATSETRFALKGLGLPEGAVYCEPEILV